MTPINNGNNNNGKSGGGAGGGGGSDKLPNIDIEGIREDKAVLSSSSKNTVRWKRAEILGQGAFGIVYLGLNTDTGGLMAVKQMAVEDVSRKELAMLQVSSVQCVSILHVLHDHLPKSSETYLAVAVSDRVSHSPTTHHPPHSPLVPHCYSLHPLFTFQNEINTLKSLLHPNIVRYIDTEVTPHHLSIFLEYISGGSLKTLIDKFGRLEESVAQSYTRQLLLGLEYLHRHGIAHRDMKGANCLVGNDGVIKLADFGASKQWRANTKSTGIQTGPGGGGGGSPPSQSGEIKGTPSWMAPEVIRDQGQDIGWKRADVWSLACTTLEMLTGKPPWHQYTNPVTVLYQIACTDALPDYPTDASVDVVAFLDVCLNREPSMRPDITSLLLHSFVANQTAIAGARLGLGGGDWESGQVQRPSTVSTTPWASHTGLDGGRDTSGGWSDAFADSRRRHRGESARPTRGSPESDKVYVKGQGPGSKAAPDHTGGDGSAGLVATTESALDSSNLSNRDSNDDGNRDDNEGGGGAPPPNHLPVPTELKLDESLDESMGGTSLTASLDTMGTQGVMHAATEGDSIKVPAPPFLALTLIAPHNTSRHISHTHTPTLTRPLIQCYACIFIH
jgi:serine/threonine protein kinase